MAAHAPLSTPTAVDGITELLHSTEHAPHTPPPLPPAAAGDAEKHRTVFYLAYGSNLCASTFEGSRGIKPLSATNVHVPGLTLTFSLPGIAYVEPCFANVLRRDPDDPADAAAPAAGSCASLAPGSCAAGSDTTPLLQHGDGCDDEDRDPQWPSGLIGVVYEVTPEDFATIIATEGGGASYADVVVPTHPLSAPDTVIEAHTLLAPLSDLRMSPCGRTAQPSLRYLNLLRTGAREHDLPAEYVAYLDALRPYTVTTLGQRVGRALWLAMWMPVILFIMGLSRVLADKKGRSPKWWAKLHHVLIFGVMWPLYDSLWKSLFGDGERTIVEKGEARRGRKLAEKAAV
ncbi:hypothetical protein EDC01DRAFT_654520 [Geopyxis carbonaria]|nr:hypothetical protein EDC01DRAFT_654520 [Geopyxis carbonaria]